MVVEREAGGAADDAQEQDARVIDRAGLQQLGGLLVLLLLVPPCLETKYRNLASEKKKRRQ